MVAIKIMEVKKQPFTVLANEVNIMKKIYHENVVIALDAIYVEAVKKFWLVMEYVNGCSLRKIVRNVSLEEGHICFISSQCVKGLDYLHKENIVHRDIKSNNVLVDVHGRVKITDFGTSYIYDENAKKNDLVVSPCYMAPEVVARRPYDYKIDIWSYGITLIEIIDGEPPYIHEEGARAMKLIKRNGRPSINKYDQLSDGLKSFIDTCLVVDASHRGTARDLLNHEFLNGDQILVTARLAQKNSSSSY
ncbi:serine/threonine-protein kinase PAK 3-like [Ruditapes philippinarum]|uniref:serine/threonine-protein kinase PAK 3-like n=1 Tax=Ruditapes philippinarum TaxID=129788 RepID=UPI00295A6652|nr:serine/threonine-protein kinase PAK 3-like [Ruditapes philippinarum]